MLHLQAHCVYEYGTLSLIRLHISALHFQFMFLAASCFNQRHSSGTHLVKVLQLLDAISRVACLGFEKSYRESIVLMTRSYLDKVKALGASENNTVPSEATIERTEVCDD